MRIGAYEVQGELGRGGMGVVYRVRAADGRTVALKLLARPTPGGARERFERERRLLASLGEAQGFVPLLDAGEDPNHYSPVGGHSHATPLHQAVISGRIAVVRLLVERGARLDIGDIHRGALPLDWATYFGHAEIADYLRARSG